ncbi:carbohydrate-binding module family 50 protein [Venturia nashicola]|nr:carbohydrate-binding module family 50 protein [Venturia nashicola]
MNHPTNTHTSDSQPSSRTSSTPAQTDALRPRQRRLISGLDDDGSSPFNSAPGTRLASPRGSPPGYRQRSPNPGGHSSRTYMRDIPRSQPFLNSSPGIVRGGASSTSLSGLWENSWSALQGLASGIIGNGSAPSSRTASTIRKPLIESSPQRRRNNTPQEWGPLTNASRDIGTGSIQDRETLVRAAKRKDLLRNNGDSLTDSLGRYKRRNSDDFTTGSVQPNDQDDRDALVYLHQVKPNDTFVGITIKYSCQPAVIRKANRMWPNDPIQSRKTILLPVDSCAVKGRLVNGPQSEAIEEDLRMDERLSMHESPSASTDGWHRQESPPTTQPSPEPRPLSSVASTITNAEPPWKHDSWVILPNEKEPTEIARLPRRHLGYFPRARRKSVTFSDIGTPGLTPTASLDLPRIPSSPGSAQSEAYAALRPNVSRNRSSSNAAFAAMSFLHGPGGVGTLGHNVRLPGPGEDKLNKLLGPHLPNVAPPPNQTVFTPWNPGLGLEEDLMSLPNLEIASASSSSPSGNGIDIQEMSGAVERWVRKTAKRTADALGTANATAGSKGAGVRGMGAGSGITDLIELTDAFEIGDGELEEHHGIEISRGPNGSSSNASGGSALEGIRGRKLARDESASKSGKGD